MIITYQKIKDHLAKSEDITAVYLFGSMARGQSKKDSDIDIAILFSSDKNKMGLFDRRLTLEIELERITGRPVDVIDMQSAQPVLQHQILRHGILLLEKDRQKRVAFEVFSRRRYFEMRRLYKRRNAALFKRLGG